MMGDTREKALELALLGHQSQPPERVLPRAEAFCAYLHGGTVAIAKTTDLTFAEAVRAMQAGKLVMRPGIPSLAISDYARAFTDGISGAQICLLPKDVTATDWQIVGEKADDVG